MKGSKLNELWMSLQKEHGKGMLVYMFLRWNPANVKPFKLRVVQKRENTCG
jgi:hypothetical protein